MAPDTVVSGATSSWNGTGVANPLRTRRGLWTWASDLAAGDAVQPRGRDLRTQSAGAMVFTFTLLTLAVALWIWVARSTVR